MCSSPAILVDSLLTDALIGYTPATSFVETIG